MIRAAFTFLLAALTVGPLPIAIHEAIEPGHRHDAGAAICSSDDHHDGCHVCDTLAGRSLDVAAVAVASAAVGLSDDVVPGVELAASPVVALARSRDPPVTLI